MDTGNQLLTVPVSILSFLGAREQDLLPVANNLNTVTGKPLDIIGAFCWFLLAPTPPQEQSAVLGSWLMSRGLFPTPSCPEKPVQTWE